MISILAEPDGVGRSGGHGRVTITPPAGEVKRRAPLTDSRRAFPDESFHRCGEQERVRLTQSHQLTMPWWRRSWVSG
jgi:hypothetical protein